MIVVATLVVLPPEPEMKTGDKKYILKSNTPHEYYPIKLYVIFYQESLHGSTPDTRKKKKL